MTLKITLTVNFNNMAIHVGTYSFDTGLMPKRFVLLQDFYSEFVQEFFVSNVPFKSTSAYKMYEGFCSGTEYIGKKDEIEDTESYNAIVKIQISAIEKYVKSCLYNTKKNHG